jgi:hypothetical protein
MARATDDLIDKLVRDLQPVPRMQAWVGVGRVGVGLCLSVALAVVLFGPRDDIMNGAVATIAVIAAGLFLVLALATTSAVIDMARPAIGHSHGNWAWAWAIAALLPLAAVVSAIGDPAGALAQTAPERGAGCVMMGTLLGLISYGLILAWLRQGAPTSPGRAGLLAGISAGSIGMFAFSFHCASNDIVHLGLWHALVVVVGGTLGRIVTPPLIRW